MDMKEFEDLISIGRVKRSFKIGSREITMHTLAGDEYATMSKNLGASSQEDKQFEALQRGVLASAIDTIDGKSLSLEEKMSLLGKVQFGLANMMYVEYMAMVSEQEKQLEDSKKNSSQTQTG
jgi:hypothetical protein